MADRTPSIDPDLGPDSSAPEREGGELAELRKVLEGQDSCMLSTIDAEGLISSRPMAVQDVEFDGTLWFLADADSGKVAELERDGRASAAFSSRGQWAAIAGTAAVVRDAAKKRELWSTFTDAFVGDREPEDDDLVLIRLDAERGEYWTSNAGPRVLVELVRSALGHHEPDVGDHGGVDLADRRA